MTFRFCSSAADSFSVQLFPLLSFTFPVSTNFLRIHSTPCQDLHNFQRVALWDSVNPICIFLYICIEKYKCTIKIQIIQKIQFKIAYVLTLFNTILYFFTSVLYHANLALKRNSDSDSVLELGVCFMLK